MQYIARARHRAVHSSVRNISPADFAGRYLSTRQRVQAASLPRENEKELAIFRSALSNRGGEQKCKNVSVRTFRETFCVQRHLKITLDAYARANETRENACMFLCNFKILINTARDVIFSIDVIDFIVIFGEGGRI